ncbi:MAG: 4Fe-4S cluster-binding domain-containing protein [Leptospira sp.]|nr:4Fe-4S cluster-binding domain-containing protein [Leptospira sp.]
MTPHINEIYLSVSGEGITAGVPTIFIRIAGCSLRCGATSDGRRLWCDTPYGLSPKAGTQLTIKEMQTTILELNPPAGAQVLITGGEPLEGSNRTLTQNLSNLYPKICLNPRHPFPRIETNGAEPLDNLKFMNFTMDYKLPGSGMEQHMHLDNFRILAQRNNPLDELKFVVRDKTDYNRTLELYKEYQFSLWTLYSPVADELDPKELAEWLKSSPIPGARLSLQIHKVLWGNQKGV